MSASEEGGGTTVGELPGESAIETVREKYRQERDKRLRPDANQQYRDTGDIFPEWLEDPYAGHILSRAPLEEESDVIIIGGGIGALVIAARLRDAGIDDIRVVEKASDFGGTWYWNRYPGAMCDVDARIYLPLLEETGYIPTQKYVLATEIRLYLQELARFLCLNDKAVFQTTVTGARWDEAAGRWLVSTDRGDTFRGRFMVIPTGQLLRPKLPGIPGIEDFQGHCFHTSRWDYGYTGGDIHGDLVGLADKRVAVIGTGSTAIQCIPPVGESAERLFVFQRTPSAVDFRNNHPTDVEAWKKSATPGWQRRIRENFTQILAGIDVDQDLIDDGWTHMFGALTSARLLRENPTMSSKERAKILEQADLDVMNSIRARIDREVTDSRTADLLKPWYNRLCKRPCFHDEYLEAFNLPNVALVDTDGRGPDRVSAHGVLAGDAEYRVDCIIYATGFEVGTSYSHRVGFDVQGRAGLRLSEKWSQGPRSLHGVECHGFPNAFFTNTQHAPRTANYTHLAEEQAKHIAYIISEVLKRGAEVVEVTADAEEAWGAEVAKGAHRGARFRAECTPGFYNGEGKADDPNYFYAGTYTGGPVEFFALVDDWRHSNRLEGLELRAARVSAVVI
jgi:cyclohexanone monooxygenase